MKSLVWISMLSVLLVCGGAVLSAEKDDGKKDAAKELTLERLFPEKGLFGPGARAIAFSHDGKHAAWLHRLYPERRHGNDLWIYDVEKGEAERVTSVSVMSEFRDKVRKVRDDRIEKAKKIDKKSGDGDDDAGKSDDDKSGGGTKKDTGARSGTGTKSGASKKSKSSTGSKKKDEKGETDDDSKSKGDWVGDDDAEAEKAPRYDGVSSYTWSPDSDELLFVAGGDIYRMTLADRKIERLTRTKSSERSVDYLPDGSGYTYMRDSALFRVKFGSHLVEQIEPGFASGESLAGYEVSPDGKRVALTTSKGEQSFAGGARKVKIARYRDRFMNVREVPRLMADDPLPSQETLHYIYDLDEVFQEEGKLRKIFSRKRGGPRDIVTSPQWSADSTRVAFSVFDQETENVHLFEARIEEKEEGEANDEDGDKGDDKDKSKKDGSADKKKNDTKDGGKKNDDDEKSQENKKDRKAKDDEEKDEDLAREVFRFLHFGGPNTPRMIRPYYLADSRFLAFICELSGYRQIHVLDTLYQNCEQLTRGRFEIYPIDISEDRTSMFVTATKEHPSRQDIYRVSLEDGTMDRLTTEDGFYSGAAVSPDGKHALATYATYGKLSELTHVSAGAGAGAGAGTTRTLTDSHPDEARELTQAVPEMFSYANRHGHEIRGHWFAPDDFDPKKDKRPLLVYVYGGPLGTRKSVVDGSYRGDSYFFAWYMAKKHGYVTCTIDPRGQSGYGAMFEKANFEQVGRPQVEDLVDGVRWFIDKGGVDAERVAIHGWSFGGFQTQMCLYLEPDVFAAGIAGAGPTEWENYNAWYTTGTIGESRTGETDLDKYSLLPLAKNLEGKLLLVHGMEDANVLYQDTVRVYRELLKAGKETHVELFLDPTGGHGLGGDIKTLGRFRKYEEFLLRTVGNGNGNEVAAAKK